MAFDRQVLMRAAAIGKEGSGSGLWEAELERVNRALRVVSKSNRSLHEVADVVTWLNQVCHTAVDIGGFRMAGIGFAEQDEQKTVRVVGTAGIGTAHLRTATITWADEPHGCGPAGTAVRTGQVCISRDIADDPTFEPWREEAMKHGFRSSISLPLASEGRTFGFLAMYADVVNAFGPREVEVLKELADDLAFGVTVVLRARAERHEATEALSKSQRMLMEAQRIAHVGHWEHDLQTSLIKASEELCRIFGLPPQSRGRRFSEFLEHIHVEDRPRVVHLIEEWTRTRQHHDAVCRIVRPDGQVRFIHSEADTIEDDAGRPVVTIGIAQDITEQHEAEQALEDANRALEAKNIALREVLASIEAEQSRIGRQITTNVRKLVFPLVHSLKQGLNRRQQRHVEQIEHALEEITSPFIDEVSQAVASLTPAELRICSFIKRGLAVKEIAELEHLSPQTIAAHRRNIRRKLGIANQKINLASYLRTIFADAPARTP